MPNTSDRPSAESSTTAGTPASAAARAASRPGPAGRPPGPPVRPPPDPDAVGRRTRSSTNRPMAVSNLTNPTSTRQAPSPGPLSGGGIGWATRRCRPGRPNSTSTSSATRAPPPAAGSRAPASSRSGRSVDPADEDRVPDRDGLARVRGSAVRVVAGKRSGDSGTVLGDARAHGRCRRWRIPATRVSSTYAAPAGVGPGGSRRSVEARADTRRVQVPGVPRVPVAVVALQAGEVGGRQDRPSTKSGRATVMASPFRLRPRGRMRSFSSSP